MTKLFMAFAHSIVTILQRRGQMRPKKTRKVGVGQHYKIHVRWFAKLFSFVSHSRQKFIFINRTQQQGGPERFLGCTKQHRKVHLLNMLNPQRTVCVSPVCLSRREEKAQQETRLKNSSSFNSFVWSQLSAYLNVFGYD